jgi:regulatory protein YycI of two-component signal transduction system YycFG
VLHALVTDELLRRLEDVFPAAPSRSMSVREVDHLIGQQEVIAYLQRLMEQEKDLPLNAEDL